MIRQFFLRLSSVSLLYTLFAVVFNLLTILGAKPVAAAAGDLDTTFGTDGKVITTVGVPTTANLAYSIAIQSDGKIVVAGEARNGFNNSDFAVVRYNTDGSLDTSFGQGGKVTTAIGSADDVALSVALQPDGKIVVAGVSDNGSNFDFAIARYNMDGSLDTNFGTGGKVTTEVGYRYAIAFSVAIQSDGKIVVAGGLPSGESYAALVRYNADGTLDTNFGTDGKVTQYLGPVGIGSFLSVALHSDGKIVVAGYSYNNVDYDFALARYDTDGSLDTTFGTDGNVITAIDDDEKAYSVALQSDGKIVVAGQRSNSGGNFDFALVRHNTDGSLDTNFGTGGKVTTEVGSYDDYAHSVALQPDGKIVVAGFSDNGSNFDFAIARYNMDGSLDTSFGTGGKVTTEVGSYDDYAYSVALQPDGKIVVAGCGGLDNGCNFSLVRYAGTPSATSSTPSDRFNALLQAVQATRRAGNSEQNQETSDSSAYASVARQLAKQEEASVQARAVAVAGEPAAIPAMPHYLMLMMVGLVGLFGLRRLRAL